MKRKNRIQKRGHAAGSLRRQKAVPAVIRLTDGEFAARLAGKYAWRIGAAARRATLVHRMRPEEGPMPQIPLQIHLHLRHLQLAMPVHARLLQTIGRFSPFSSFPALSPPTERRPVAGRGMSRKREGLGLSESGRPALPEGGARREGGRFGRGEGCFAAMRGDTDRLSESRIASSLRKSDAPGPHFPGLAYARAPMREDGGAGHFDALPRLMEMLRTSGAAEGRRTGAALEAERLIVTVLRSAAEAFKPHGASGRSGAGRSGAPMPAGALTASRGALPAAAPVSDFSAGRAASGSGLTEAGMFAVSRLRARYPELTVFAPRAIAFAPPQMPADSAAGSEGAARRREGAPVSGTRSASGGAGEARRQGAYGTGYAGSLLVSALSSAAGAPPALRPARTLISTVAAALRPLLTVARSGAEWLGLVHAAREGRGAGTEAGSAQAAAAQAPRSADGSRVAVPTRREAPQNRDRGADDFHAAAPGRLREAPAAGTQFGRVSPAAFAARLVHLAPQRSDEAADASQVASPGRAAEREQGLAAAAAARALGMLRRLLPAPGGMPARSAAGASGTAAVFASASPEEGHGAGIAGRTRKAPGRIGESLSAGIRSLRFGDMRLLRQAHGPGFVAGTNAPRPAALHRRATVTFVNAAPQTSGSESGERAQPAEISAGAVTTAAASAGARNPATFAGEGGGRISAASGWRALSRMVHLLRAAEGEIGARPRIPDGSPADGVFAAAARADARRSAGRGPFAEGWHALSRMIHAMREAPAERGVRQAAAGGPSNAAAGAVSAPPSDARQTAVLASPAGWQPFFRAVHLQFPAERFLAVLDGETGRLAAARERFAAGVMGRAAPDAMTHRQNTSAGPANIAGGLTAAAGNPAEPVHARAGTANAGPAVRPGAFPGAPELTHHAAPRSAANGIAAESPAARHHEIRQRRVENVPLQVAAKSSPAARLPQQEIRQLEAAIKNVESDLVRARAEWAEPKLDLNRLADEVYKAFARRMRFERQRRGL